MARAPNGFVSLARTCDSANAACFCAFPTDFEADFRDSHEAELGPDIIILGRTGFNTSWNLMRTGVQSPTVDGVDNLNWEAGPSLDQNDDDLADILAGTEGISDLTMQGGASQVVVSAPSGSGAENTAMVSDDDVVVAPDDMDFRCGGLNFVFDSSTSKCGGLNDVMKGRFHTVFDKAKLEALFSGLADSTRISYQSSWLAWERFCFVRNISTWLAPGHPGWDEPLLDFLIWTSKILGKRSSTLKTRFAAIRFMRLINGNVDFTLQAHRAKAMMKGLKKREGVVRKHPFNTDLLRWMQSELVAKSGDRNGSRGSMYMELFAACVLGFFYLLRISELGNLKWEDISIDTKEGKRFLTIKIKQSKTDVFRDGIIRSLVEVDSVLCPVKTFMEWKEMAYDSNNPQGNVFGINLRVRVSAIMKTAALANGVFDKRIDTHSLRAGGATALYTQGVPLDVIQRWGRWKSLTFHQYLWHDASALNHLSEVIVQSSGLIDCLRLMNKVVHKVRFQDSSTMGGNKEPDTNPVTMPTSLFLPNEDCKAGGAQGKMMGDMDDPPFPPSDLPAYTASPTDVMHGTRALTKREKQEKLEKKEESDNTDRDTTKVELFSGEEELSSKSSVGSPSVVSRTACPYARFDSDRSDSSGDTVPVEDRRTRHKSRNADRKFNRKDRRHTEGRKTRGAKKRGLPHRVSRSGGRRTSRKEKEEREPNRPVRLRAASDSPARRRRRKEDEHRRGRTPDRRASRKLRRSSPREKDEDNHLIRVFSTSSDGDTPASSSGLPRVFFSNEYLEKETGFWTKRAREGEAVVREFSREVSSDAPRITQDILANRE